MVGVIDGGIDVLHEAFLDAAGQTRIRKRAKDEHKIWSRRGRARLHVGSYLVWEQLGQRLRKGRLSSSYYTVVAQGQLGPEGFGA